MHGETITFDKASHFIYTYMCLKRKFTSPIVIYYMGLSTSINVHRNIPERLN